MTDSSTDRRKGVKTDRRYAVSANRGGGRHRVRYVETGGADVDTSDCIFCQSVPAAESDGETESPER